MHSLKPKTQLLRDCWKSEEKEIQQNIQNKNLVIQIVQKTVSRTDMFLACQKFGECPFSSFITEQNEVFCGIGIRK